MTRAPSSWPGCSKEWAKDGLINIVGGCCGTTPEHIRAIAEVVAKYPPRQVPETESQAPPLRASNPSCMGSINVTNGAQNFVMVGERTNVTGSARFRKLIEANDYAAALEVARQQVESGANMLDVNMDEGMLDSEKAMMHLPQPDRRRARHLARADHDRLLEMVGDRGRARNACRASRSSTRSA